MEGGLGLERSQADRKSSTVISDQRIDHPSERLARKVRQAFAQEGFKVSPLMSLDISLYPGRNLSIDILKTHDFSRSVRFDKMKIKNVKTEVDFRSNLKSVKKEFKLDEGNEKVRP